MALSCRLAASRRASLYPFVRSFASTPQCSRPVPTPSNRREWLAYFGVNVGGNQFEAASNTIHLRQIGQWNWHDRSGVPLQRKTPEQKSVLIIGSGNESADPAEKVAFSIQAFREAGMEPILVNPNIRSLEYPCKTVVPTVTPEFVENILEREKPIAVHYSMGIQSAYYLGIKLTPIFLKHGIKILDSRSLYPLTNRGARIQFIDELQELRIPANYSLPHDLIPPPEHLPHGIESTRNLFMKYSSKCKKTTLEGGNSLYVYENKGKADGGDEWIAWFRSPSEASKITNFPRAQIISDRNSGRRWGDINLFKWSSSHPNKG